MNDKQTYNGIPVITATPAELRRAVTLGRFVHRDAGMAFYEFEGKVFVVEADKPVDGQSMPEEK